MSSRTTTSIVTFNFPFVLAGYTDELPPGEYEITAEDEILQSRSFTAYRRTATHLSTSGTNGNGQFELRSVDHRDIGIALAKDRAGSGVSANSGAALSPSEHKT